MMDSPEAQLVGRVGGGGRGPQGRSPASGCSVSWWLAPPAAVSLPWPPWAAPVGSMDGCPGQGQDPGMGRAEAGGGSGSHREGRSVGPSHTPWSGG